MKKVIFLAAIFAAPMAMACPDLAGNYSCVIDGQPKRTIVSQAELGGVMNYRIDQEDADSIELIADGMDHDASRWMDGLDQAVYNASCDGDARLMINANGIIMNEGQPMGKLQVLIAASRDGAGNLAQNVTGMITGDFGSFPVDEQNLVCARE